MERRGKRTERAMARKRPLQEPAPVAETRTALRQRLRIRIRGLRLRPWGIRQGIRRREPVLLCQVPLAS